MVSNSLPYLKCPLAAGRDSLLSTKSTFNYLYSNNIVTLKIIPHYNYDSLIGFPDHALAEQFVEKHHHDLLIVETNTEALLDHYGNQQPLQ